MSGKRVYSPNEGVPGDERKSHTAPCGSVRPRTGNRAEVSGSWPLRASTDDDSAFHARLNRISFVLSRSTWPAVRSPNERGGGGRQTEDEHRGRAATPVCRVPHWLVAEYPADGWFAWLRVTRLGYPDGFVRGSPHCHEILVGI